VILTVCSWAVVPSQPSLIGAAKVRGQSGVPTTRGNGDCACEHMPRFSRASQAVRQAPAEARAQYMELRPTSAGALCRCRPPPPQRPTTWQSSTPRSQHGLRRAQVSSLARGVWLGIKPLRSACLRTTTAIMPSSTPAPTTASGPMLSLCPALNYHREDPCDARLCRPLPAHEVPLWVQVPALRNPPLHSCKQCTRSDSLLSCLPLPRNTSLSSAAWLLGCERTARQRACLVVGDRLGLP
jgi:hypothetical protein